MAYIVWAVDEFEGPWTGEMLTALLAEPIQKQPLWHLLGAKDSTVKVSLHCLNLGAALDNLIGGSRCFDTTTALTVYLKMNELSQVPVQVLQDCMTPQRYCC